MQVLILGYITSFVITFLAIPAIITVATTRKLFDQPNNRSSHDTPTPSLGGIGIFGGAICGIILWTPAGLFDQLQYTLAAIVLLFLVGARDDLVPIPPLKKLAVQIIAAVILVYKADVQLDDWWGLLGVFQLNEFVAILFTLVAIVGIINAYNLIDGINGLAGSIGLLSCFFFGTWFYFAGCEEWAVVAASLAGSLTAFLKFNLSPAKIFMGDTGSLLIGLVCSVMAIEFISISKSLSVDNFWRFESAPVIALTVLILPIYDTVRVFSLRIRQGRSPFHADRTHLHHLLLDGGFSHTQATLILVAANLVLIAVALLLQHIGINRLLLAIFMLTLLLNWVLEKAVRFRSGSRL